MQIVPFVMTKSSCFLSSMSLLTAVKRTLFGDPRDMLSNKDHLVLQTLVIRTLAYILIFHNDFDTGDCCDHMETSPQRSLPSLRQRSPDKLKLYLNDRSDSTWKPVVIKQNFVAIISTQDSLENNIFLLVNAMSFKWRTLHFAACKRAKKSAKHFTFCEPL